MFLKSINIYLDYFCIIPPKIKVAAVASRPKRRKRHKASCCHGGLHDGMGGIECRNGWMEPRLLRRETDSAARYMMVDPRLPKIETASTALDFCDII